MIFGAFICNSSDTTLIFTAHPTIIQYHPKPKRLMFGFKYFKAQPTEYILQYKKGKLMREGAGLSFFYFAPATSLVKVPVGSVDVPFIFEEVTSDFQDVTIQGQITYRVIEPLQLASMMNFTLSAGGKLYASEDPQKLPDRLINHAKVVTRSLLKNQSLRQALGSSDAVVNALQDGLRNAEIITSLGLEVLGLSILAIKPMPETARALAAEARENVLLEADEAIHRRRNAAVEQERTIRENELNTEIAVENKKRQIAEAKMEAKMSVQKMTRKLSESELSTEIALEEQKSELVKLAGENARKQADAHAYNISTSMKAFSEADPKIIEALSQVGMDPNALIAQAFKDLAGGANKIGQLNITPDLLREIISHPDNSLQNFTQSNR